MIIGNALRAHLLADTTWRGEQLGSQIAALVGDRIYPLRLPQKATPPAIVLQRISAIRFPHLRGSGSLARPRFQVDSYAALYNDAVALGALVRRRLEGFHGEWSDGASPPTTARVTIFFDNELDLFEPDILGGLCRHSADYRIFHSTAAGVL